MDSSLFKLIYHWYDGLYTEDTWLSESLVDGEYKQMPLDKWTHETVNEKQQLVFKLELLPELKKHLEEDPHFCAAILTSSISQSVWLSTLAVNTFIKSGVLKGSELQIFPLKVDGKLWGKAIFLRGPEDADEVWAHRYNAFYYLPVDEEERKGPAYWKNEGRRNPWNDEVCVQALIRGTSDELHVIGSIELLSYDIQEKVSDRYWKEANEPLLNGKASEHQYVLSRLVKEFDEHYGDKLEFAKTELTSVFDGMCAPREIREKGDDSSAEQIIGNRLYDAVSAYGDDSLKLYQEVNPKFICVKSGQNLAEAFTKLSGKSRGVDARRFDFVVCKDDVAILAIEVDGAAHRSFKKRGTALPDESQAIRDFEREQMIVELCHGKVVRLGNDSSEGYADTRPYLEKCRLNLCSEAVAQSSKLPKDWQEEIQEITFAVEQTETSYGFHLRNASEVTGLSAKGMLLLRIPCDGSTYCETEASREALREALGENNPLLNQLPSTIDEYLKAALEISQSKDYQAIKIQVKEFEADAKKDKRRGIYQLKDIEPMPQNITKTIDILKYYPNCRELIERYEANNGKLTPAVFNKLLMSPQIGLLEEKYPTLLDSKKAKLPTKAGREIGVYGRLFRKSDGHYWSAVYSNGARKFLRDNLGIILGLEKPIRLATPDDSDEILAIYAPYVENTAVSFEDEVPSKADFKKRIEAIQKKYPYLVAQDETGKILGYAYAHELRERAAFQWDAELSIYLASEAKRQGLGTALYSALIDLLKLQGIRAVYGIVTYPNEASDKLHAKLGFELMARQKNAGYKSGAWHDMSWYVKYLGPFDDMPEDTAPFSVVSAHKAAEVEAILARVSLN